MKISRLELWTQNIDDQISYYVDILGLPILEHTPKSVTFKAGQSELHFTQADPKWRGFYHFAFNILEEKFDAAHLWLSDHVMLIPNRDWRDIFFFKDWNARGIYSKDPAGNIVEFVTLRGLKFPETEASGNVFILAIGEVGIVSEKVLITVSQLNTKLGTRPFHQTQSESFAAVGDENGLLLVAREGREWYPNDGKMAQFAPMKIELQVDTHDYLLETKLKSGLFKQIDITQLS